MRDTSSHHIYCNCRDCRSRRNEICEGCGETCDEDFCFCRPTCVVCADIRKLALEQFTFTIPAYQLPHGDYQDCWNPDTYMASWEENEIVVADTQSDARWLVISCRVQSRAAGRQYYTWYCSRIGVEEPCDDDFMRDISS